MSITIESKLSQLFGAACAPVLKAMAMDAIEQQPDTRSKLFDIGSMDREIDQWTKVASFGTMNVTGEGEVASKDTATQLGLKTFTAVKYAKAIGITDEMIQDQRFDLVNKMVRSLGKSAYETQMAAAFNIFNNAYTTETGFDGAPILTSSHSTLAGMQSNVSASAADISLAGLKEGENYFRSVLDERGKHLIIEPKVVLVPNGFLHDALELINTPFKPGSANNDINSLQSYEIVSSPYLTDDDAWFMLSSPGSEANGLKIKNRSALETKMHEDTLAGVLYYKAQYRQAIGCDEWRGIWGGQV